MARRDQLVLGPRHGDVGEPALLELVERRARLRTPSRPALVHSATTGKSAASPRSGDGSTLGGRVHLGPARSASGRRPGHVGQNDDGPLQALGLVHGQQLDACRPGSARERRVPAELLLGREEGEERAQARVAVEVGEGRPRRGTPRGSRRAAATGDVDAPPRRRGRSRRAPGAAGRAAAHRGGGATSASSRGEQREPRRAPRREYGSGARVARAPRTATRSRPGRPPRRLRRGSLDARPRVRVVEPPPRPRRHRWRARSAPGVPSSARSRGPIGQRGPVSRRSSAALAVGSSSTSSVRDQVGDLGQGQQAAEPDDLDRDARPPPARRGSARSRVARPARRSPPRCSGTSTWPRTSAASQSSSSCVGLDHAERGPARVAAPRRGSSGSAPGVARRAAARRATLAVSQDRPPDRGCAERVARAARAPVGRGKCAGKALDVADRGAAPAVDRLARVADGGDRVSARPRRRRREQRA